MSQPEKIEKGKTDSITRRRLREFLEQLWPFCANIEENAEGAYVIKPKQGISAAMLIKMHDQIMKLGGKWSVMAYSFMLPADARLPNDPVTKALDLLRVVFKHSRAEISECIRVLVDAGMAMEEISQETGASKATLYRYMQPQPKTDANSQSETASTS
jgi:hypothetical protein